MSENNKKYFDIESVIYSQMKILGFSAVKCPEDVGNVPEAKEICFAGNTEAENFIDEINQGFSSYMSEDAYWKRDFGLWHTQFEFKDTPKALVVQLMAKGDFKDLQKIDIVDNYKTLVVFSIFPHI